ncbi:MAG: MFS transporter [archaeon]
MSLTKAQQERTKKYSIVDGCANNVLYGFGEQYITPFALRLGALPSEIALLGSVPSCIGSCFQLLGARLSQQWTRKKLVTLFVFLQAGMLLPLFFLPLLTKNMLLLTLLFAVYLVFSNMTLPAWTSWMGQVVSAHERAVYFSKRGKYAIIAMVLSIFVAGVILNTFDSMNIWVGFGILFGIALLGRLVSWFYLLKHDEPEMVKAPVTPFREFLGTIAKNKFGRFVIFRSLFSFSVTVAGPFFAVFMLRDLHFSYVQYMLIVILPLVFRSLSMPYWGRNSVKFGTRNIMLVSGFLISLVPFGWFIAGQFFSHTNYVFVFIVFTELISGFGWAGMELTTFNYVLESTGKTNTAVFSAYFNVILGVGVLLGGLLGSYLVSHLTPFLNVKVILLVMFISFMLRFLSVYLLMPIVKELRINKRIRESKLFLELAVMHPVEYTLDQTLYVLDVAENKIKEVVGTAEDVADEVTTFIPHPSQVPIIKHAIIKKRK